MNTHCVSLFPDSCLFVFICGSSFCRWQLFDHFVEVRFDALGFVELVVFCECLFIGLLAGDGAKAFSIPGTVYRYIVERNFPKEEKVKYTVLVT